MKRRKFLHHLLILLLLVGMHGLRMLSEIIEPRKLLGTMAGKGAFAGMFPGKWENGLVSITLWRSETGVALWSRQEQGTNGWFLGMRTGRR
jgi:hypothetical protein